MKLDAKPDNTMNEKLSLKKIIFTAFLIAIPFALFMIATMLPSFSDDVDIRVLQNEIFGFFSLALFMGLFSVGLIIDMIMNIAKNTEKYTSKTIIGAVVFLIISSAFTFGSFRRSEAAYKDFYAEDLYIVGRVERIKPENDGSGPFVILVHDANEYTLFQMYVELKEGAVYRFKYYKYSNILYMIEEIDE
jgi:hypothetical protein